MSVRMISPSASHVMTPPGATRGRTHDELPLDREDAFAVDRRRVIRCSAFRRLQYKTQVFVNQAGDHFRTRLSHTLEVAQVGRRLAAAIGANETLTEVICLAHDLGHPPFGHAGEAALRDLMTGAGGFEHNLHAHRVVTYLEHPYPPFRGLNLTFEVREGIVKHHTPYDRPESVASGDDELATLYTAGPQASVEAQIACLADEIAYIGHDLEDAVGAELVHESDLEGLPLWHASADAVRREHVARPLVAILRPILDHLQSRIIEDAAGETLRVIAETGVRDADGVRAQPVPMVRFSPTTAEAVSALQRFLHDNMYRHPRLVRMDHKASHLIEAVFGVYQKDPRLMPPRFARRVDEQGVERVVCDYVAGMTDRFCQKEFSKLFEPFDWE